MSNFTSSMVSKRNRFSMNFFGVLVVMIMVLGNGQSWGQSYLGLDGGFEGSATIDNTVQTAAQANKWTKNNSSTTIADETTVVRSGGHSLSITNSTTTGRRVWSPLFTVGSTTSQVTLQFWRRTATITNNQQSMGGVGDGTTSGDLSSGTYAFPSTANTYEKVTYTRGSWTYTNIAGVITTKMNGAVGMVYIDDICMYAGAADVTAPSAPTLPVIGTPTTSSLNVAWTAASGGVDNGGYLVVRGISDPATAPNANGIYAVGNTIAAGMTVVYRGTGTSFTDTGLSLGTKYYYRIYTYDKAYNYCATPITGNGTTKYSSSSDIIANTSFTYPTNITYSSYQGTTPLTTSNSIEVGQFDIRDGGVTTDADALATTLTGLTLNVANSGGLRRIALFDGTTNVAEVAAGSTATFSGLTLAAADGGSKTFSVRVSFLTSVTDNQQFSFTVSSATASAAGSTFAAAAAGGAVTSTAGDNNRIEVTATNLLFNVNPSNVNINTAMNPSPTVVAKDGNGSIDLDFTGSVTLTSTGTIAAGATNPVSAVNGTATFSNLLFSASGTGITIAGAASGVTATGNSNTFNATNITPTLTADASANTVDNNIDITFPTDAIWEAAITAVKIGGTALTVTTDYVVSAGNIQLKPSGLNALLTTSGSKAVTIEATGYSVASVTQVIGVGADAKLAMSNQPIAPGVNGSSFGSQPAVTIQDQYGNTTASTASVVASVGAGTWTLGGTTTVAAVAGTTTFSGLTATSLGPVSGATISFTCGALTGVSSNGFNIIAPIIGAILVSEGSPTVDAAFHFFCPDNATWSAAITSITVGGTALISGYSISGRNITFTPSANALLQSAGSKNIAIIATGFVDKTVSFTLGAGAAAKLGMSIQPTAPALNGAALATQPSVYIQDQYGNTTTSTASVVASVGAGTWTLGGTTTVAAVGGTTTFSGLTATCSAAVTDATINFTCGVLSSATSNTFNIPVLVAAPSAGTNLTFGIATSSSFTTTFTAPGTAPTGYLVLRRAGSAVTGSPVAGNEYTLGQTNINSGVNEVVYVGASAWNTYAQSGLTDYTAYHYAVYSYNGSGATINYSSALTGSQTTASLSPTTASPASGISSTGFTANWAAGDGASSYRLDVSTFNTFISPISTSIVVWNFPNATDDAIADEGIILNNSKTISTIGSTSTVTYATNGATTSAANATGWDSGNGSKYWMVDFNSTGYYNLKVSSKQRASGTGPRDFKLQYKISSGGVWSDVTNGALTTAANFTTGVLSNLSLPTECDNQSQIYLRWIMTSNTNVNGTTVANTGTSQIDDIFIEGNISSFVIGNDGTESISETSKAVTTLSPNTTYYYRVRSASANSTSANSNVISVTTSQVSIPTAIDATNVTSTTFRANTNSVSEATGYVIDVATDLAFNNIVSFYTGMSMSGTFHNITGLSPNTTYYYRVRATSPNSTSANSNIISVTTLARYTIAASANDGAKGSVTGGGAKDAGASVSLSATPTSASYRFVNWTENGSFVSAANPYPFTASVARTLVANFDDMAAPIAITTSSNASTYASCPTCDVTVSAGGQLTIDEAKTFNSVTVAAGGKLTLADGFALTAPITLQSSESGTATFVDSRTDVTPTAINGTVEQRLPTGRNWYVGLPLDDTNVPHTSLTAAGASSVSYWSESAGAWVNTYTGNLTAGVGYIAVSNAGASTDNISFNGKLRSGALIVPVTRTVATAKPGFNLIANPYPSYLNAMTAMNANALVEKTIWYRTKGTSYQFETVNTTSGEGTNISNTGVVKGYVPPMQAFWVRVLPNASQPTQDVSTSLTFTNAMRYHANPTVATVTIPTTALKAPSNIAGENPLLRLQISKGVESDEAVIYFNANAATGYDAYDSQKRSNTNPAIPELYTMASDETLAINGLPEMVRDIELPLGYYAGTEAVYRIRAKEIRNIDASTRIILKDGATEYDLTNGDAYEFNSPAYNGANRFSIIFRTSGATNGIGSTKLDTNTNVYVNAYGQLTVNTSVPIKSDARVSVYNAVGQLISIQHLTSSTTIASVACTAGVYWVKVTNDGENVIRKVVLK